MPAENWKGRRCRFVNVQAAKTSDRADRSDATSRAAPLQIPGYTPTNTGNGNTATCSTLPPSAQYLTRERRRHGVCPVRIEVFQEEIEFLEVNGYLADRSDAAIAAAVSRFLADSVAR
jgi:hypothetical protein